MQYHGRLNGTRVVISIVHDNNLTDKIPETKELTFPQEKAIW